MTFLSMSKSSLLLAAEQASREWRHERGRQGEEFTGNAVWRMMEECREAGKASPGWQAVLMAVCKSAFAGC